ncbi:unnamed protein product [Peniophora sp. CBMAI 1063]|nr:unnamed protein product [Peniophora sp. CBMAI 1063]
MSLFSENFRRSFTLGAIAVVSAHALAKMIPNSLQAYALVQTAIAMLSLSALMLFVYTHHRAGGNLITIRNEEHALILAFGTFWFAMLILWRAMRQSGTITQAVAEVASTAAPGREVAGGMQRGAGYGSGAYPRGPWGDHWPCSRNDMHCIVEEWSCSANPKRRIETDVMKLLMSDFEVSLVNDSMQEFYVRFHGPTETPFAGGVWKIHVELPDQYPFKSPSIGFMNKIFHPNIDELSGSVCLDVINQTWSPMYDMINIFEMFLPQLLRYPNPADPLNGEAAALLMRHPKEYEAKVKEYVQRWATKEAADHAADGKGNISKDEEEDAEEVMSDVGSISDDDA